MSNSYRPGPALGVCGPTLAVLVDLPADDPMVADLFTVVSDPASTVDEALEVLVSRGLRAVADFAVAERQDEGVRAVVRGRFAARFGDPAAPITGRGLWNDQSAPGGTVELVDPAAEPGAASLPVQHAVVRAGSLLVGEAVADEPPAGDADEAGRPARAVGLPAPESDAGAQADPVTVSAPDVADEAEAEPEGSSEVPAEPEAASQVPVEPEAPSAAEASPARDGADEAEAEPEAATEPEAASDPEAASEVPVQPEAAESAEPAADRVAAPAAAPEIPRGHTLPSMLVPAGAPAAGPVTPVPPPPQRPASQPSGAFIDSIPWSTPDAGPADVTMVPPPAAPDLTINRADLPDPGAPQPGVPTVVAVRCARGHLSPAYAGVCRVCGDSLPPQQPFETARPPLGQLRFSNGEVVLLDRPCILGRNPRVPAGYTDSQPNLVRLADPDKDISSQHLEVGIDFWHVTVKDLGSTNGTELVAPGEPPLSLRPDDPVTIEPGSTLILAGVLSFTFEVVG